MGVQQSEPAKIKPTTFKKATSGESQYFIFSGSHMQGIYELALDMEYDSIFKANIQEDISFFGVFEGHKGEEVVQFVEQHFLGELLKKASFNQREYARALEETFMRMDDMMINYQNQKNNKNACYSGCSANVCLMVGKDIYIANAGQSRSILYRDGQNFDLSSDHTLDNPKEQERLILSEILGDHVVDGPQFAVEYFITRALGYFQYKNNHTKGKLQQMVIAQPEIIKTEIQQGDKFLLMGTHGLFQTLSNLEMLEFINERIQGKQISEQVLAETVEQLMDIVVAPDQKSPETNNKTSLIIYFKNN